MAYRRADHERWQQMDFVLGIKIELSNQHPVTDICDFVQGDYPKDFVFDGWHPQCFCYATPILISEDEMAKVSEAFARGETYIPKGKPVTDTPKGFKEWVKDHKERIQKAKNPPYWVRNNKAVVNGIWRKKASEEKNTGKDTNNSTTNGKSKAAGQNKDIPHKAVKKVYNTNAELEETFKGINSEFVTDKWFENGDLKISVINKKGKNGETNGKGYIGITAERLDRVKMAMGKIGLGKSSEITFDEADAMATLWHEITHNRNKHGLMRLTDIQRSTMEMMNEFVARKTLPEFYTKLGCSKIPYPEFMENRTSTGYNKRVLGYDFIIQKLGLDPAKVLESAKNNLFNLRYTHQDTTAEQALMDGGLDKFRRVDGKPIGRAQLRKMLTLCRKGTPINKIEEFLRNDGIIK